VGGREPARGGEGGGGGGRLRRRRSPGGGEMRGRHAGVTEGVGIGGGAQLYARHKLNTEMKASRLG